MRWLVALALTGALAAAITACERVVELSAISDARAGSPDGGFVDLSDAGFDARLDAGPRGPDAANLDGSLGDAL